MGGAQLHRTVPRILSLCLRRSRGWSASSSPLLSRLALISFLTPPWGEGSPGDCGFLPAKEAWNGALPGVVNDSDQAIIFNESNSPSGSEVWVGVLQPQERGPLGIPENRAAPTGLHTFLPLLAFWKKT